MTIQTSGTYANGIEDAAKIALYWKAAWAHDHKRFDDQFWEAGEAVAGQIAAGIGLLSDGKEVERYRHVKRGTVYEIIGRAELQVNNIALSDGVAMLVYRGEDGKLWVRSEAEFMDGRFEVQPEGAA